MDCKNYAGLDGDLCWTCNQPQSAHKPLRFEDTMAYADAKRDDEEHEESK
jgi:hypothetical protein